MEEGTEAQQEHLEFYQISQDYCKEQIIVSQDDKDYLTSLRKGHVSLLEAVDGFLYYPIPNGIAKRRTKGAEVARRELGALVTGIALTDNMLVVATNKSVHVLDKDSLKSKKELGDLEAKAVCHDVKTVYLLKRRGDQQVYSLSDSLELKSMGQAAQLICANSKTLYAFNNGLIGNIKAPISDPQRMSCTEDGHLILSNHQQDVFVFHRSRWTRFDNPTRSPGPDTGHLSFASICGWHRDMPLLLVVAHSASPELAILGIKDEGLVQFVLMREDALPQFPLSVVDPDGDCCPVSLALDFTDDFRVPPVSADSGDAPAPPMPVVWSLTTDGTLMPFRIVDRRSSLALMRPIHEGKVENSRIDAKSEDSPPMSKRVIEELPPGANARPVIVDKEVTVDLGGFQNLLASDTVKLFRVMEADMKRLADFRAQNERLMGEIREELDFKRVRDGDDALLKEVAAEIVALSSQNTTHMQAAIDTVQQLDGRRKEGRGGTVGTRFDDIDVMMGKLEAMVLQDEAKREVPLEATRRAALKDRLLARPVPLVSIRDRPQDSSLKAFDSLRATQELLSKTNPVTPTIKPHLITVKVEASPSISTTTARSSEDSVLLMKPTEKPLFDLKSSMPFGGKPTEESKPLFDLKSSMPFGDKPTEESKPLFDLKSSMPFGGKPTEESKPLFDLRTTEKQPFGAKQVAEIKFTDKPLFDVKPLEKKSLFDVKSFEAKPLFDVKPFEEKPLFDVKSFEEKSLFEAKPATEPKAPFAAKATDETKLLAVAKAEEKSEEKQSTDDSISKPENVEQKSLISVPKANDVKIVDKSSLFVPSKPGEKPLFPSASKERHEDKTLVSEEKPLSSEEQPASFLAMDETRKTEELPSMSVGAENKTGPAPSTGPTASPSIDNKILEFVIEDESLAEKRKTASIGEPLQPKPEMVSLPIVEKISSQDSESKPNDAATSFTTAQSFTTTPLGSFGTETKSLLLERLAQSSSPQAPAAAPAVKTSLFSAAAFSVPSFSSLTTKTGDSHGMSAFGLSESPGKSLAEAEKQGQIKTVFGTAQAQRQQASPTNEPSQPMAPAFGSLGKSLAEVEKQGRVETIFGTAPVQQQIQFASQPSQSPSFGATLAFGQPSFGQIPTFGQPSAPAFGQPAAFGQPPASTATGSVPAFGHTSTFGQPAAFGQPVAFGSQPLASFGTMNASAGGFAAYASNSGSVGFGALLPNTSNELPSTPTDSKKLPSSFTTFRE